MKFNAHDLYAIQDCLCSYKVLLNWLPSITNEDKDLKYIRMQTINHLCDKCDDMLEEIRSSEIV